MTRITYVPKNFSAGSLAIIESANLVCAEYQRQGYDLTLRQLYYQFVARGWLANKMTEYKRLGAIINDARLAGLLSWDYIVDRTRNVRGGDGWMDDPSEVINEYDYSVALWEGQTERVEVWIEKDALVGVLQRAASALRVPYFACRGYTSQSEAWGAARRIERYLDEPGVQHVTVVHLGDHDPSGIDMTRDIDDRLAMFLAGDGYSPRQLTINRIALNMDQVEEYDPPPNPAKMTDSRAQDYVDRYGESSWELDALEPTVIGDLIRETVMAHVDTGLMDERRAVQLEGRATLAAIKEHYTDLITHLQDNGWINTDAVADEPDADDDDA